MSEVVRGGRSQDKMSLRQTAIGVRRGVTTPRGESSRSRILDAAAKVLALRGYSGTSVSEIADLAGTQAGSLYYHFVSREQLIEEVFLRGAELAYQHAREAVATLPPSATARERLAMAILEHVRFTLEISDYARAVTRSAGQTPPDMQQRVRAKFRRYGKFLDELIRNAMDDGSLDARLNRSVVRLLIIGAANWTPEWFREGGGCSATEIAELMIRLCFEGFGVGFAGERSQLER
jgi:AcrR family transcriptional regulator